MHQPPQKPLNLPKNARLRFKFRNFSFFAKILQTKETKPLLYELLDKLPLRGYAEIWGGEIYFSTPIAILNGGTLDLRVGDIGFWPPGSAVVIFFGKTPASETEKPVPASQVIVFARIEKLKEVFSHLKLVQSADSITVSLVK